MFVCPARGASLSVPLVCSALVCFLAQAHQGASIWHVVGSACLCFFVSFVRIVFTVGRPQGRAPP